MLKPASLLIEFKGLFVGEKFSGPVLDLACGGGHNGIFLAREKVEVIFCDKSQESLDRVRSLAGRSSVEVHTWQVDLEVEGINPLPEDHYGGILVFRYLHRPLIPCIRKALRGGGVLVYETFTVEQPQFGKPRNPHYLLGRGELQGWFHDWEILHYFEGIKEKPKRAIAQIVCRKPLSSEGRDERNMTCVRNSRA